jgi:integrase
MSIRFRQRRDGSTYTQVRYRIDGKSGSVSFDNHAEALKFEALIGKVGPAKALEVTRIVVAHDRALTVGGWLTHHIDHLTGVEEETIRNYRRYTEYDYGSIVDMPLAALTADDVRSWMQNLKNRNGSKPSGKTVANKHGFLAGALGAAVERGHLKSNPCDGVRLPRWERLEMCFLEPDEYKILRDSVATYWRPLVDFLVSSGARWSEATALKPADINRDTGTVRIVRAWKKVDGGYELGAPKTKKSVRTINVPLSVVDRLSYDKEFVFTNSGAGRHHPDGVVRSASFSPNVWHPAVQRAHESGLMKTPRIHDLRHTCAAWLIAAGRPLPAIQAHLGHESIVTTVGTYGHLDRSSGQGNADVMGPLIDTD